MSHVSHEQFAGLARPTPAAPARSLAARRRFITSDRVMAGLARVGPVVLISMLAILLAVLLYAAWPSIQTFGWHFLVNSKWRPNELSVPMHDAAGHVLMENGKVVFQKLPPDFGALPAVYGTAITSMLAIVFAVPLSFGAALFLVRLSPRWLAGPVSFAVEFLAAIPSIAY